MEAEPVDLGSGQLIGLGLLVCSGGRYAVPCIGGGRWSVIELAGSGRFLGSTDRCDTGLLMREAGLDSSGGVKERTWGV
jgi:hypothetical protein